MRYCVRCAFARPTDIADSTFLDALERAGLMRLSADGISFDLLAPASVSRASEGAWAAATAERLGELRDDWTVTPVPYGTDAVD